MLKRLSVLVFPVVGLLVACAPGGPEDPTDGNNTNPPPVAGAPVLGAIGDKEVPTGSALTFTISATDPNGDAIVYSANGAVGPHGNPLMNGASFNTSTRQFSWSTPGPAGSYSIRFTATDQSTAHNADSETITIDVLTQVQYGQALYITNCQSCHGVNGRNGNAVLVAGATAPSINFAIANVGTMGSLSSLGTTKVNAIVAFLATVP